MKEILVGPNTVVATTFAGWSIGMIPLGNGGFTMPPYHLQVLGNYRWRVY